MPLKRIVASALLAPVLIGAPAAFAHHNYVSHYDMKAPEKSIKGTVDSFWFVNPHIRFYIKVPNETTGEEEMWIVEGRSRNILVREGWTGSEVKKGGTISLAGKPANRESMKTHLLLAGGVSINGEQINFGAQDRKLKDFQLGGEGAATSGSHLDKDSFAKKEGAAPAVSNAPVEGAKKPPIPRELKVSSSFVKDGGVLPETSKCTRDGGDGLTVPLSWTKGPEGTKSYAVVMHHYPTGAVPGVETPSHYWLLWNVPASVTTLSHGNPKSIGDEGGDKDGTRTGYTPPCSPPGETKHAYTIGVYALSEVPTALGKGDDPKVTYTRVMDAINVTVLDTGSFTFLN